jgi:hypothetical protein
MWLQGFKRHRTYTFQKEFISKWLFDVEIFFRMKLFFGKDRAIQKMYEVPLRSWIEKEILR